jgi:hypothetical protein
VKVAMVCMLAVVVLAGFVEAMWQTFHDPRRV